MKNKAIIMTLSLVAAVLVYLCIEKYMPYLSPQLVYGIAAGVGFVIGVVLNYLWLTLSKRGSAK